MNQKIIKQLENKEFVKKLLSMKNDDDVKKLFKQHETEISETELNELREIFSAIAVRVREIPENALEKIAGGSVPLSDYFRQAGEHYGVSKGGTPSYGGNWMLLWLNKKPGTPDIKGTPLGDFLFDNANELAMASMTAAVAGVALSASYMLEKGKWWRQNSKSEEDA